jgi:dipeptidyl aminopeptidase/acylaminoacyl peptidase
MVRPTALLLLAGALLVLHAPLRAQPAPAYRTPSAPLAAIVDAPLPPAAVLTPDRSHLLLLDRPEAPSIAELARPELRLAGLRLDPAANAPSRDVTYTGLSLQPLPGGSARRISGLPAGARIAEYDWAADSRHLAFALVTDAGVELWLAELASASARRLTGPVLNNAFGDAVAWLDPQTLVIRRIPEGRQPPPPRAAVPAGPVVQENRGQRAAARTFDGLLADAHDEALFEHYATSQLALVSLAGDLRPLGAPGIVTRVLPSPDGTRLLTETLVRPFSYVVPYSRFPTVIAVLDRTGRTVHTVAKLPLFEAATAGSIRAGPRQVAWRADAPATLSWAQLLARPEGTGADAKRDAWYTHAAPFTGQPELRHKFAFTLQNVVWGDDELALLTESSTRTRQTRTWRVAPGRPDAAPELVSERSSQDRYQDPGTPVLRRNAFGRLVIQRSPDGRSIYRYGPGATPEGERPFVDEYNLATKQTRRLWQSAPPWCEEFVAFLDPGLTKMLTRRESAASPPNYAVRDLAGGEPAAVTNFPNPYPQFAGMRSEVIRYRRADGVPLSGKLYLPPGYTPDRGPLPTLVWAYPREFLSEETAGQVNATPERFARIRPSTALPFVLAGYAVLDDPAMPIVGRNGKPPNDTYVDQLVASAQAAVDELVRRGVADRDRIAVAGHSYGAFMTANLLAHSKLFRAGIARSGAYNRTLTPFGFQSEERTYWQAQGVYQAMSPFNHADKIKTPILLIHGEADNNSGTFPMQSERFYAALKGHGATVRYVVLPHESHSYRARESLLHTLWEMETWLDTHLKRAGTAAKSASGQ